MKKKYIRGLVKNHIYMKFKCLKFILMIIKDRFQIQERYVHINFPSRMCAFNEAIDNYIVDVRCHFIVFFFFTKKEKILVKLNWYAVELIKKIVWQKAWEFYCTKMSTLFKYEIKLKVDGIGVPRLIRIQPK